MFSSAALTSVTVLAILLGGQATPIGFSSAPVSSGGAVGSSTAFASVPDTSTVQGSSINVPSASEFSVSSTLFKSVGGTETASKTATSSVGTSTLEVPIHTSTGTAIESGLPSGTSTLVVPEETSTFNVPVGTSTAFPSSLAPSSASHTKSFVIRGLSSALPSVSAWSSSVFPTGTPVVDATSTFEGPSETSIANIPGGTSSGLLSSGNPASASQTETAPLGH
ncbi:hypothetical protein H0H81_006411 [Sphagnurus paluster]|uniref:Uncharacterized protein n=1 Tax=Sphagnurus paluster TaxID=117069 RepID=A0A9P7FV16_9AGAR|nr:hypothetical protein H0H81_006411 [Sphagnurus paluster]